MFLSIRNMDAIGDFDKSSFSGNLIFNFNWSGFSLETEIRQWRQ